MSARHAKRTPAAKSRASQSQRRTVDPSPTAAIPVQPSITTRVDVRSPFKGDRASRSQFSRTSMSRQASQRSAKFSAAELADFMREEDNILPHVPDTEDWHYHWARTRIGDKDDGANVHDKLNGRMGYEIVTPDKLPPGFTMAPLSIKQGDYQGGFQYRDCLLTRCPQINYQKWQAASELRARQLNAMIDQGDHAGFVDGERRTGIFVEENQETLGVRDEAPAEEAA